MCIMPPLFWAQWYIGFHDLQHPMDMGDGGDQSVSFLFFLTNEWHAIVLLHSQPLCVARFV